MSPEHPAIPHRDAVLERFERLNVWSRGDQRAPHKPLLVLLALACVQRGEPGPWSFREIGPRLDRLLRDFGPMRRSYHPEYPFWRLAADGVWSVPLPDAVTLRVEERAGEKGPTKRELLGFDVGGQFTSDVTTALAADPRLIGDIAQTVLEGHFPEGLHADILDAVGLSLDEGGRTVSRRRPRDPTFRPRVLTAYEYRCAVCDFDLRLGDRVLALDAAHIQWHQARGPDEVRNGFALCTLHHKVFDLGAFTVDDDLTVLVSEEVHGAHRLEEVLLRHHGRQVRAPQRGEDRPAEERLAWHRREVFKGREREVAW